MNSWRPQRYRQLALASGASWEAVDQAVRTGSITVAKNNCRTPVLSLRHLAQMTDVPYAYLRGIVSRGARDPYRSFRIRKQSSAKNKRYRIICVPHHALLRTQTWIAQKILQTAAPHHSSTAFAKGNDIVSAANIHCNARWLVKLDVLNFFESITEISAYRVFLSLGYQPLVAFELARLCTRVRARSIVHMVPRWRSRSSKYSISTYHTAELGYLPQGAPTSPMLSNLSVTGLDQDIDEIAKDHGLQYSRYADDISLSTQSASFSRIEAVHVMNKVYKLMGRHGFSPNRSKTKIRPPGSRKIVLGLLVDGPNPRLTKEFKSRIRMHLYFLTHPKIGPARHAEIRGFDSIIGLRSHVRGLIAHAQLVEPKYGLSRLQEFNSISW